MHYVLAGRGDQQHEVEPVGPARTGTAERPEGNQTSDPLFVNCKT